MYKDKRIVGIIQARFNSSRLVGKVLLPIGQLTALELIVRRLRRSKWIDDVVIATTENESDNAIVELCKKKDFKYFRGSEEDVLSRVLGAAKQFNADIIVEVTGDCPFVDPRIADWCIKHLTKDGCDYVSNVIDRTFARGLDVQAFWTKTLEAVDSQVDNPIDRQHVSTWIYRNPKSYKTFKTTCVRTMHYDTSDIRLTLDTHHDYDLITKVYSHFLNYKFDYKDIYRLFKQMPELKNINKDVKQKSYEDELFAWYEGAENV